MRMIRIIVYRFFCLFFMSLLLSGCAGGLLDEVPKDFFLAEETGQGQMISGTAAGEPWSSETVEAAEDKESSDEDALSEEVYSFLEEGSGFARADLSQAQQIWYSDMERILGSFQTEVELSGEGLTAGLDETDIDRIFQCVLGDHPELFYVDGYSYIKYTSYGGNDIVSIEFSGRYTVDYETAKERKDQIAASVSAILKGIDPGADQYQKVKYVYDTVIRETDYQLDSPDNQNIYSVFVNHRSVCQGYAKATQYLLNRLGIECALVLGTVETGEGHAWNLVKVDGSYYYVDTTWGDASYQMSGEDTLPLLTIPEINYDYLNVTTAELLRTHTLDAAMVMPVCIDTAANYYVREGAFFTGYDREQMRTLFERTLEQGRNDITIKCDTQESYDQVFRALIENQEIFGYLSDLSDTVAYTQNDTQLSLTFWVTNQ